MANQFQTKEFKELQSLWQQKLTDSGFKDIEGKNGRLIDHKSVHDLSQRIHFKTEIAEITQAYYSWASEMVHKGKFKCKRDLQIWEYHSEGLKGTEIASKLGYKNRKWVNRLIQKIKNYLK